MVPCYLVGGYLTTTELWLHPARRPRPSRRAGARRRAFALPEVCWGSWARRSVAAQRSAEAWPWQGKSASKRSLRFQRGFPFGFLLCFLGSLTFGAQTVWLLFLDQSSQEVSVVESSVACHFGSFWWLVVSKWGTTGRLVSWFHFEACNLKLWSPLSKFLFVGRAWEPLMRMNPEKSSTSVSTWATGKWS